MSEPSATGPVKVTVSDPETGKVFEEKIIDNDYVIITNGRRYVKSVQVMGKTHMLAVAWQKNEAPSLAASASSSHNGGEHE